MAWIIIILIVFIFVYNKWFREKTPEGVFKWCPRDDCSWRGRVSEEYKYCPVCRTELEDG